MLNWIDMHDAVCLQLRVMLLQVTIFLRQARASEYNLLQERFYIMSVDKISTYMHTLPLYA